MQGAASTILEPEGQQFSKMKQTGTHKKKEERFNPSGQLLWDRGGLDRPFVPRSDVHKHTVTLGESMNLKDYRREDWDQPDENGLLLRKPKREDTGTCDNTAEA